MKMHDVLKCKRLALGLSQKELADMVGVSGSTISCFEAGEEVSALVYNGIKSTIDNCSKRLSKDEYLQMQIVAGAYSLAYKDTK
jgi:transcriptional regulator with XRE-family HTH domain